MLMVPHLSPRGIGMIRTLLVAAILFGLVYTVSADKPAPGTQPGEKVPAVTLVGLDGKPAALADLRGKTATVLVFVSFECPVSNSYFAGLGDLAKAHADKGVAVLVVCPSDEPAAAVAK